MTAKYMSSIPSLLKERARVQPNAPAILAPGSAPLTYEGLWEQTMHVAGGLQSLGVSHSTRVAVVLPNGPEMAAAFLGVAACATCAPINPASRASEFRFYLEDAGAQFLIVRKGETGPVRMVADERGLKVIEIEVAASAHAGQFAINPESVKRGAIPGFSAPDDIALLLHTSGTTARPKIVPLSHANLMASARNISRHLALSPSDCCLNVMPLFHIHGLIGALLASLAGGGSVVCAPGFNDRDFFGWVADFRPSWYSAVPTIHQSVIVHAARYREQAPNHRFRFVRSSSASLPPSTMKTLEDLLEAPVIEAYSMTEASHQMASNPLPPANRVPGSVGVAVGIDLAIMDDSGRRLAAGQTGEIVVRGPSVIHAYENNPEANAKAFTDGWFRTGDQGHLDEQGYLFISGRLKEIVNRGGEKVSPREVDDVLLEHAGVAQAAAFGVPHASLGEDLAAAVVLRPGSQVSEYELRQFLFSRLSEFKVPSRIVFVDTIPKGATGKVQRTLLHEKLGDFLKRPYVAPRNDLEIGLATAWEKVLQVQRVGVTDNFFELGGSSLGVLNLIPEMERATGIKFDLGDVFRSPTIAELVTRSGSEATQSASIVVPLQPDGNGIPVFCMYGINIYKDFAESLGKGQPVYGVYVREEQSIIKQVMEGNSPEISISRLVDAYGNAIARFRPHGPYRLAGFSLGGIMAVELAARLRERGEEVELVMLLDTVLAHGQRRNWGKWFSHQVAQVMKGHGPRKIRNLLARLRDKLARSRSPSGTRKRVTHAGEDFAVRQVSAFRRAARGWQPRPGVDFTVILFRALDKSRWMPYVDLQEDYGWRRYLGDRLSIVNVAGAHRSIIESPNVAELGRKARQYLGSGPGK